MAPRSARLASLLLLVAAPPPSRAELPPAQPPVARQFGADQTSVGNFTGSDAGITPGLTCTSFDPANPAPITCQGFLASFDGTLLETTVRVPPPDPARPDAKHPLVALMHGWGGSQGSTAKYDDPLLNAGYDVLRYSARGFGGSFGQTNLADVNVEGEDLRNLIGQVVDDGRFAADPSAVAVFGASYGGAHAWLGVVKPQFSSPNKTTVTIKAAVPIAGWTDLLNALLPNGRPEAAQDPAGAEKLSYVEALFFGGIRTRADRPYPNYPEYLFHWNGEMTTNEVPYAATPTGTEVVAGLQGYRSAWWQAPFWDRVRANATSGAPQVAIFAIQGFTDDLFPPREAVRMYDALRALDSKYPIALYLGDIGHPRAVNKDGEVSYLLARVLDWLGFYLAGRGTQPALDVQASITRAPDAAFDPEKDVIHAPTWQALSNATATARFRGLQVITFDPASISGFQWDPLVLTACGQLELCPAAPASLELAGDVASYETPVSRFSTGSLLVAGDPTITAWILTASHRVQLDVRVLDVAPNGDRQLVTRGTYTRDTGVPTKPVGLVRVAIPTHGNLWEVPAGHKVRFEITNVDSPYLRPSLVPSATLVIDVEVSLPVRR
jgi:predicted acyl esterase